RSGLRRFFGGCRCVAHATARSNVRAARTLATLAVARVASCMNVNSGDLESDNRPSRFTRAWHATRSSPSRMTALGAVQVEASSVPAGVRILVVDDDARIRRAVASAMSRTGFHVFTADDGKPALAVAAQTPPDLAIVDFDMPTPGVEVVRELK